MAQKTSGARNILILLHVVSSLFSLTLDGPNYHQSQGGVGIKKIVPDPVEIDMLKSLLYYT